MTWVRVSALATLLAGDTVPWVSVSLLAGFSGEGHCSLG